MLLRFVAVIAILLTLVGTSISFAQSNAVIVPTDKGYSVMMIPAPEPVPVPGPVEEGVILFDILTNGKSSGQVIGGQFTNKGWKHISGSDKIFWDLGQTMEAGIIEFELTGMHRNTKGGFRLNDPGGERAYYFGLFNHPSGNKHPTHPSNPAFIEIRYNYGARYYQPGRGAVKFQAGDAGLGGSHHEEKYGTKAAGDWIASQVYKHKVVFGDGVTALFIDGQFQTSLNYTNRPLGWRYLFLGDINYSSFDAPDNITYRNVKVTKLK